jgi:Ca2+-binding EF-hand superfamily protein
MKISTVTLLLSSASATMAFVAHPTTQRAFTIALNPATFVENQRTRTTRSSSRFVAAKEVEAHTDMETIHRDADVIFSIIDVDGNGSVSLTEMSTHLTSAGYTKDVINKIFGKLDLNKDGAISRQEFQGGLVLFTALRSAPGLGNYNAQFVKEIYEDADAVFQSADANGNGEIDESELKSHLRRTFVNYSDKAIIKIFGMLDIDGDGKISKNELRDAFVRYSALRQAIGEGPNYK